jgi:tripartite-type tricarboxylate transporter receptor subunit TctC
LGPARLPQAIIQKLNTELQAVLNDPVVREKLAVMGIAAAPGTPQQFAEQIRNDLQRYEGVVKAAGIRLE